MEIRTIAEAESIHDSFFPHDALSGDARDLLNRAISGTGTK
jgi:hypothetical protein